MKVLFGLLIAGCILGHAFVRTAFVLHYQLRKADYVRSCENKYKPSLHCEGKCQLKKRLERSDPTRSQVPGLPDCFFTIKEILLYWEPVAAFTATVSALKKQALFPPCNFFYSGEGIYSLFRPPIFRSA